MMRRQASRVLWWARLAARPLLLAVLSAVVFVLGVPAGNAAPGEQLSDTQITAWVHEATGQDARIADKGIQVTTLDGQVTLQGTVSSLLAKKYAEFEARKIAGVREVTNNLVVQPVARPDSEIEADVRRRLTGNEFISAQPPVVSCQAGVVTLQGPVGSEEVRRELLLLAEEVAGVKGVTNDLVVMGSHHPPDDEILREVQGALKWDVYLNGLPISVSVASGTVTIEGTVGNAYEKERAQRDALVPGVKEVRNQLQIDPARSGGVRQAPQFSDGQLQAEVVAGLGRVLEGKSPGVAVSVSEGIVTLQGSVKGMQDRRRAEEWVRGMIGVLGVVNSLSVEPGARSDADIQAEVESHLKSDAALYGDTIQVSVKQGVVTLVGEVAGAYDKTHATDVVARIQSVSRIINNLKVNLLERPGDAQLAVTVSARLEANAQTHAVATEIRVTAKDGVVRLEGEVDHPAQRLAAEEVAFLTSGVEGVENHLVIN